MEGFAPPVGSVYVHAPFCARRCAYCDFAVTVDREGDPVAWTEAIRAELGLLTGSGAVSLADELATVYVGGGTPSLLGASAMEGVRGVIGASRLTPGTEWTAEANPESFDAALAEAWVRSGVTRVSLGVQTFHDPALRWMGRLHGAEGPGRAVGAARAAGLTELSLDLIFGLPRALGRRWLEDLDRTLELDVPHVSLYGLTVEPRTALGRAVSEGRESPVDEVQYREEYLAAAERLRGAGYEHYEVSNFARPGHASRHNRVYWSGSPYLGLGNGAHSYAHPVRRWNVRDWEQYRARTLAGHSPEEGRETLTHAEHELESIWLGLRTSQGLPWADFGDEARRTVAGWRSRGLAAVTDGRVRLSAHGWLEMDRLTVELDGAGTGATPRRPG